MEKINKDIKGILSDVEMLTESIKSCIKYIEKRSTENDSYNNKAKPNKNISITAQEQAQILRKFVSI
jgi:hypothetical protein